jgi:hypothetical protein
MSIALIAFMASLLTQFFIIIRHDAGAVVDLRQKPWELARLRCCRPRLAPG